MKSKIMLIAICLFLTSIFCIPIYTVADDKKQQPKCMTFSEYINTCTDIKQLTKFKEEIESSISKLSNPEEIKKIIRNLEKMIATYNNSKIIKQRIEDGKKDLETINFRTKTITEKEAKSKKE